MITFTTTQSIFIVNATRQGCPAARIAAAMGLELGELMGSIADSEDLKSRVHSAQIDYADDRRARGLEMHHLDPSAEKASRELVA